ncbi:MAG: MFS transporter [Eggerthellaceae bacterium]|nr:MFS transporter [Eggerthellaceae bacterium]
MKGKGFALPLAVLYVGAFVAGFNENLVNMALMGVMDEFGVDSVTAQWLVTGYMIVATVMVTSMAFLYRRVKLRKLFFYAAGLSCIGSAMGLFAFNFALLLAARLVQAVGTGIFIPLMMNAILALVPKNRMGTYMSIGSCMITFGPAFAPVVCGALVTCFGWRSVFSVPLALMVLLAVAGAVLLTNLENDRAHLDAPSVALSAVALFALSFGLAQLTLMPVEAVMSLAVAVVAAFAFVIRQLRCEHPLIELAPCRSIRFWPTLLLVMVAMMTSFSLSVLLPLYFEGAMGMTAFVAGVIILVPVLVNAGTSLLAGRIMDKRGSWPLIPAGFAIVACGLALLSFTSASLSLPVVFVAMVLAYAGVGLVFSPSQTAGLRTLPPEQNPYGVALSTTAVQIAACIGPSMYIGIMSSAQAGAQSLGAQMAAAQGFSVAILVAGAIALAGFVISLAYTLAERRRATAPVRRRAGGGKARAAAGTVGAEAASIASFMEPDPYTLPVTAKVGDAMRAFVDLKVGGMPVVDGRGNGVGYLSDGDIMRYLADSQALMSSAYSLIAAANAQGIDERVRELAQLPVSDVATSALVSVGCDASLKDVCALLAQHKIKKVPVVDGGRIVGTVNRSDVLRYAMESYLSAGEQLQAR